MADLFSHRTDGFLLNKLPGLLIEYRVGQNQSLAQNEGHKIFRDVIVPMYRAFWGPRQQCDEGHGKKDVLRMLEAVQPGLTLQQKKDKLLNASQ